METKAKLNKSLVLNFVKLNQVLKNTHQQKQRKYHVQPNYLCVQDDHPLITKLLSVLSTTALRPAGILDWQDEVI